MNLAEIKFSRKKMLSSFIMLFVLFNFLIYVWMFAVSVSASTVEMKVHLILGIPSLIILVTARFYYQKINKVGLIISEEGITDFSSGADFGLIKWEQIKSIAGTFGTIKIYVHDPDYFLNKVQSRWKKKVTRLNSKMIGTPVFINAVFLEQPTKEILKLLQLASEQNFPELDLFEHLVEED